MSLYNLSTPKLFKEVQVPQANLVGEEGKGFYELMAFFNRTRLPIAAQAVGLA